MQGKNGNSKTETRKPKLPPGYGLDISDPDFVFLVRQDGSQVAVFNGWSASADHIELAAEEDLRRDS